ncbi:serine protease [Sorangium cellulosum]|uniref:Serine protease n=1 Tax=Sorangium cellulosum TaxID=56 RepID=A0A4P2QAR2_SORCE|nr:trypsin-like peptidase domain-containing protein [Sorangium cellulosum]AUX26163.1 serine protease [Sorangium cellulosum]
MTAQLAAHGDGDLALLHERVARARRAIVAIRAGALATTGWVALGNGVVVTSRRGLGYPAEVALTLEDGRRLAGRVIAADVGRDVALVAPGEPPGVAALSLRAPGEPRLGERAAVLSCLPGQGLRLAVARICQVPRKVDGLLPSFELDVAAPPGAAVLDTDGRVLGVIAAPAGAPGELPGHSVVLPVGSLQPLLGSVDRPLLDLRDRAPVYRCPACEEPFDIESDRCLGCGRLLPHAFPPCPARAAVERMIRQALSALGIVANRARVGPRTWRIAQRPYPTAETATQVDIEIDEAGRLLSLRAPVVGVPAAHHEPFYRFLLTMNDQSTGEFRLSIADDEVSVSCVASLEGSSDHDAALLIDGLVQMADEYRRTLADTFEAAPRFESASR